MHAKTKTDKKAEKKKESFSESVASIAAVLVSGLFIITFIFQAFVIPSGSMENTLLVGDHVFVDRLTPTVKAGYTGPIIPYREIKRGDIIVFLSPVQPGLFVVKRVMGIPGDKIHLKNGVVYRNGVALDEPYVLHDGDMGDHRSVSLDSRFWGFIPRENIVGRPLFIYWSFITPPSELNEHPDMAEKAKSLLHVVIHFFDQTRWNRMFRLAR